MRYCFLALAAMEKQMTITNKAMVIKILLFHLSIFSDIYVQVFFMPVMYETRVMS